MAEQLICNQQVDGSTPFTSSIFYGGIPERPKGADCKSVVTDFAGPNPASPTNKKHRPCVGVFLLASGSLAIRNRHLPCKCAGPHLSESRRKLVFVRLSEKSLPLANTMLHRLFIIFIPLHRTFKLPIKLRTRFPAEFFYFFRAYRILPVVAFSVFNKFQFSVRITEQGHYFLH